MGSSKGFPASSTQEAFYTKDPAQKLRQSLHLMNPDPSKPSMTKQMTEMQRKTNFSMGTDMHSQQS